MGSKLLPIFLIFLKPELLFLLTNQYVHSTITDNFYRCLTGSGMGLVFSGEVADAAFLASLEPLFLRRDRLATMGIKNYFRFKDDLLLAVDRRRIDGQLQAVAFRSGFDQFSVQHPHPYIMKP